MLIVYTTKTCAYCPMVKKYLTMKNLAYKEVDLTEDAEKRQELFDITGQLTVPITTNGKDYIIGFKPALLSKLAT